MFFHVTIVIIIRPPESTTVCRGSDVNISCGYQSDTTLPVLWIINQTRVGQEELLNSASFLLNNVENPMTVSLTIFSINGITTAACVVNLSVSSSTTTVTVIGMYSS